MKELVFGLLLLMQACGPLLAQTEAPQPERPGLLQRLAERARETKTKVQGIGEALWGFVGTYYEDNIEPLTESYVEWASNVKTSVVEKIQRSIDFNY
ncbi:uncharacterized protein V6R79_005403 [Siganus canaliculatus]